MQPRLVDLGLHRGISLFFKDVTHIGLRVFQVLGKGGAGDGVGVVFVDEFQCLKEFPEIWSCLVSRSTG